MHEEIEGAAARIPGVQWSICLRDGDRLLADVDAQRVLPTASVGKVLLLLEVARRIDEGLLDPGTRLSPVGDDLVGDSGLWQHLAESDLSVQSLAVLVAAVSDNLATNVLLREVGLAEVAEISVQCGIPATRMLDRIRDVRRPTDPPWPSEGSAVDLSALMARIARGDAVTPAVSATVARWLAIDVDTSMVAGAFALDPLAHLGGPLRLFHKTGTDDGVRADAGHVTGPMGSCSYAVIARWDPTSAVQPHDVLRAMRDIGSLIVERVC